MGAFKIVMIVLEVIASLALILIVLLQSGKESGLGVIAGNGDSYMNKNKKGDLNKTLASATKWVALVWGIITLTLSLI